MSDLSVIKQHLIDPEICIRCNTCEATCPVGAITHDDRNYVVDAAKCNLCMDCIAPVPDRVDRQLAHGAARQGLPRRGTARVGQLPAETDAAPLAGAAATAPAAAPVRPAAPRAGATPRTDARFSSADVNATRPPQSAAQPAHQSVRSAGREKSVRATVTGNVRVTEVGREYDTHHIVLDFGSATLPLLEGQSIGILPPGVDGNGRPHHARQYSIASPRNGERPGYNNVSLTVKRVLEDHQGRPVRGVASNYLCDLHVGDDVDVIGPFGTSFLMPNHPKLAPRHDLHRHRQRADAGDDRMAAPPARARASSRAASCCCSSARAPSRSCRTSAR